jgi:hypothetical protein
VYHIKQGQRLQMRPPVRPPRGPLPGASLPLPERKPLLGRRWWFWLLVIGLAYWLLSRQP